jgi:hypothetical protein
MSATTDGSVKGDGSRTSGSFASASGCRGETANTQSIDAKLEPAQPWMAGGSLVAPTTMSARPSRSASQVPLRIVRHRTQDDSSASKAAITGSSDSNSMISSVTIHRRSSQPLATCRTRCESRDTSSASLVDSCARSCPAGWLQAVAAAIEQECVEPFLELPGRMRDRRQRLAQRALHGRGCTFPNGLQQCEFVI